MAVLFQRFHVPGASIWCVYEQLLHENLHSQLTRTGTIIGSMISRRYGRRMCMFTMSLWAIVCATLAITSKSPTQILVTRVLNCKCEFDMRVLHTVLRARDLWLTIGFSADIYIGMELAVVPIYQSEITHKKISRIRCGYLLNQFLCK